MLQKEYLVVQIFLKTVSVLSLFCQHHLVDEGEDLCLSAVATDKQEPAFPTHFVAISLPVKKIK